MGKRRIDWTWVDPITAVSTVELHDIEDNPFAQLIGEEREHPFETMVVRKDERADVAGATWLREYTRQYDTEEEARTGHAEVVEQVRADLNAPSSPRS